METMNFVAKYYNPLSLVINKIGIFSFEVVIFEYFCILNLVE